jgi:hypothetical protein
MLALTAYNLIICQQTRNCYMCATFGLRTFTCLVHIALPGTAEKVQWQDMGLGIRVQSAECRGVACIIEFLQHFTRCVVGTFSEGSTTSA